MTARQKLERWGPVILGVVSVLLVFRIVRQLQQSNPAEVRVREVARLKAPSKGKAKPHKGRRGNGVLDRYDPNLNITQLEHVEKRSAPDIARNPFNFFVPKPVAPPASQTAENTSPPPPPAPPPLPLKALGYEVEASGVREAYITYQDEIFVVRTGDSIASRYKILQVTPKIVEVVDSTTGQHGELPIPK